MLQNNFPERLHRAIIYPSGLVFYGIWNVIKWFLDPVTQAKACPVIYLSGVQQYIDDEYIPTRLGGSCDYEYNHEHFEDIAFDTDEKAATVTTTEADAS